MLSHTGPTAGASDMQQDGTGTGEAEKGLYTSTSHTSYNKFY